MGEKSTLVDFSSIECGKIKFLILDFEGHSNISMVFSLPIAVPIMNAVKPTQTEIDTHLFYKT